MKYSRNEVQRMATEEAIKILMADKDMMLSNTSYGWFNGTCLVGLTNDADSCRATKTIYIVLDYEGSWVEDKVNLSIYDEGKQLLKIIKKFVRTMTRDGEYFEEV